MTSTTEDVVLTIDEGTSGTRAAVVGRDGHVSCLQYASLQIDTPRPGVVEQDADVILEKTLAVCRATIAQSRAEHKRIVALAIATQRCSAVLWDTRTGRALAPVMVWQDTRYVDELSRLAPRWDPVLVKQMGRPVGVRSPYLWAVHQLHETPAVARAFDEGHLAFGTIDTWLLWHLSDQRVCVTTPTNVTSGSAYVLADHRYQLDWIDALGFPRELLPILREDADQFGRTRTDLLGIDVPILACAGDQHAGAIGLGCLDREQAMCVHGTGSFVDVIAGPVQPVNAGLHEGTLTMMARRAQGVSHFAVETFVATTGSALNWVCEKLQWFDDAKHISRLAATTGTSGNVTFIPALTGLRVPAMEPAARASLTGISMATTRAEVARAVLEGIAHSVASCIRANEEVSQVRVSELVVGGGLASSATLLQIQADLTGIPVRRLAETDRASLRGIAFLAGSSGLLWDSLQQARATLATDAVFEPSVDAAERRARRALWHARVEAELTQARQFKNVSTGELPR